MDSYLHYSYDYGTDDWNLDRMLVDSLRKRLPGKSIQDLVYLETLLTNQDIQRPNCPIADLLARVMMECVEEIGNYAAGDTTEHTRGMAPLASAQDSKGQMDITGVDNQYHPNLVAFSIRPLNTSYKWVALGAPSSWSLWFQSHKVMKIYPKRVVTDPDLQKTERLHGYILIRPSGSKLAEMDLKRSQIGARPYISAIMSGVISDYNPTGGAKSQLTKDAIEAQVSEFLLSRQGL